MTKNITAVIALCGAVTLFAGCGAATVVVKDKYNQFEKYLKDATVLPRWNVQLDEAKKSRAKLKETADQFTIDAEVALKQVARVEAEQEKSKQAFEKLQDIAKKAGLPKLAEATPEDKAKQISVAGKNKTGEDVYQALRQYKDELKKANAAVAREKNNAEFKKRNANKIKDKMSKIDTNIDEIENQIEEYKMYQEMLAASKKIEELGLNDDKMKQLVDGDTTITEIRRKVDALAVGLDIKEKESAVSDLKADLTGADDYSVTGDDLL